MSKSIHHTVPAPQDRPKDFNAWARYIRTEADKQRNANIKTIAQ